MHGSLQEVVDTSTGSIVRRFERQELIGIAETLRRYASSESSIFSLGMELSKQYPFDWLGRHRPNLVMFGDAMAEPAWTTAQHAVENCDVLITVGTSAEVYPAALLPEIAMQPAYGHHGRPTARLRLLARRESRHGVAGPGSRRL